jgi:hypothetical protein
MIGNRSNATLSMIEWLQKASRCVVAFWCGFGKLGSVNIVGEEDKTGEATEASSHEVLRRILTTAICRLSVNIRANGVRRWTRAKKLPSELDGGCLRPVDGMFTWHIEAIDIQASLFLPYFAG